MKRKRDIDSAIAMLLSEPRNKVSSITSAFLNEAMRLILEDGVLHLDGFGRFKLGVQKLGARQAIELTQGTSWNGEPHSTTGTKTSVVVAQRHKVYFSKARPFTEALHRKLGEERNMEKFGVDESVDQEQLEKAAAEGCPECGAKVEKHGKVLRCPVHGTEPFEKGKKA